MSLLINSYVFIILMLIFLNSIAEVEIHIQHRSVTSNGVTYPIDDLIISGAAKLSRPGGYGLESKFIIFSPGKDQTLYFKITQDMKSSRDEQYKFTGFDKVNELLIFEVWNEMEIDSDELQLRRTIQELSNDIADGFVSYLDDKSLRKKHIESRVFRKKSKRIAIDVKHQKALNTPIVTVEDHYEDGNTVGITIKGFNKRSKGARPIAVTLKKNNRKYTVQIEGKKCFLKDMKRIDKKSRIFPNQYTFLQVSGEKKTFTWTASEIVKHAADGKIEAYKCFREMKKRTVPITGQADQFVVDQSENDDLFEAIDSEIAVCSWDVPEHPDSAHSDVFGDIWYDGDEKDDYGLLSRLKRYYRGLILKNKYN